MVFQGNNAQASTGHIMIVVIAPISCCEEIAMTETNNLFLLSRKESTRFVKTCLLRKLHDIEVKISHPGSMHMQVTNKLVLSTRER